MRKSDWIKHRDGYLHRPWWKVAVNTVLRAVQAGRDYRWLIVTKVDLDSILAGNPIITGYGFSRVRIIHAS